MSTPRNDTQILIDANAIAETYEDHRQNDIYRLDQREAMELQTRLILEVLLDIRASLNPPPPISTDPQQ